MSGFLNSVWSFTTLGWLLPLAGAVAIIGSFTAAKE
jgi:hypothetical protein